MKVSIFFSNFKGSLRLVVALSFISKMLRNYTVGFQDLGCYISKDLQSHKITSQLSYNDGFGKLEGQGTSTNALLALLKSTVSLERQLWRREISFSSDTYLKSSIC